MHQLVLMLGAQGARAVRAGIPCTETAVAS